MFVIRGDIFRSLGDPAMAIINYSQAIKLDDSDYMAFYNRAETYREVSWNLYQFGRPKKKVDNISENFLKILDPPLCIYIALLFHMFFRGVTTCWQMKTTQ